MKQRNNEGSSLIEILIAIAVLAVIVIPVCSSLVMSHRLNAKTETMLQAQLEVSSAVETLMAKGIPNTVIPDDKDYGKTETTEIVSKEQDDGTVVQETVTIVNDLFPNVNVKITGAVKLEIADSDITVYYNVSFTSETDPDVVVSTSIRAVEVPQEGGGQ